MWTISLPQPSHLYTPDQLQACPGSYILSNSSCWLWRSQMEYLYSAMRSFLYEACRLAHRALAALRALRRRCSGVILAARALPPILPPSRPSSDRIWDLRDLAGCSGFDSGSTAGRSPNNLCTAMKPACTSSSGSLPDGFRIHPKRCTFRRLPSRLWKTKVAHYPAFCALR